jgi:phage baseplate assembly protein W
MTTVKYPFTIYGGKVMTTEDPAIAAQSNIVFCLSTQAGERVMNPAWGIEILNASYSMGADIKVVIKEAILAAFRTYFPEYQVRAVEILPYHSNPTYITVTVRWGKYGSAVDVLSRVGVQLPGGGEQFQGEGF